MANCTLALASPRCEASSTLGRATASPAMTANPDTTPQATGEPGDDRGDAQGDEEGRAGEPGGLDHGHAHGHLEEQRRASSATGPARPRWATPSATGCRRRARRRRPRRAARGAR